MWLRGQGMAPLYGASASPGPSPRSAAGRDDWPIMTGRLSEDSIRPVFTWCSRVSAEAVVIEKRPGGGKSYPASFRNACIWSRSSTTLSRSSVFSASSRSISLWLLLLETCPLELPLGGRVRLRATSRLSTFFILFDWELSVMIYPLPSPPSSNHRWQQVERTDAKELGSTSGARKKQSLFRAVAPS